jgi:alpha-soluble NSF attachment protein
LKVADLAALAGQYQRAIERYESVAKASLNSNLTKWSVKDYFFKAGACYLANKVNTLIPCISSFQGPYIHKVRHRTVHRTRSYICVNTGMHSFTGIPFRVNVSDGKDLTDAVEAGDEDAFLDKLQAYDQMSKLDKWKTAIFLKVKEGIDAEPDLT